VSEDTHIKGCYEDVQNYNNREVRITLLGTLTNLFTPFIPLVKRAFYDNNIIDGRFHTDEPMKYTIITTVYYKSKLFLEQIYSREVFPFSKNFPKKIR
jgi:hypothetical protein